MYGKILLTGTALAGVLAWGIWWANHPHASGPGAVTLEAKLSAALGVKSPGIVVTPAFDHYIVTFAPDRVAGKAGPDRPFFATMTPWEVELKPMEGGLWQVVAPPQDLAGRIVVAPNALATLRIDYTAKGYALAGIYDESLGFLRNWQTDLATLEMVQSGAAPLGAETPSTVPTRLTGYHASGTARPGGTGIDLVLSASNTAMTQEMVLPIGTGIAQVPFRVGPSHSETRIEGLRWAAILPLLAQAQRLSGAAEEPALRQIASTAAAAMPLFDSFAASSETSDLVLALPQGPAGAARAGLEIAYSGTGAQTALTYRIDVEGMSLPATVVPAWAGPLVPRDVRLDLGVAGYDPMGFLKAVLNDYAAGIVPDAAQMEQLFPNGKLALTLAPSRIAGPAYSLDFEGAFARKLSPQSRPDLVQGTAEMTGMEHVLAALGTAPDPEQVAPAVLALTALQVIARREAAGRLRWDLEMGPEGIPNVNGTSLGDLLH
ncbi:hypothetical protein [Rhodobacter maris]|uniref:DUF2125 domain-containing protein n=1 Tax=Rhodobacter maris TaxID=446682 RepID=A0A285T2J7_9RHOB|nr:hypothetical protein [Rhodobacter maris]SOC15554.1 hypothetical protein SAMN05877831_11394 [Rhodobacter maris]